MKISKKNYPQVYLEECKYRVKKIQMSRFISIELDSDSDSESDSEAETKSDTELMAKLELVLILSKTFYIADLFFCLSQIKYFCIYTMSSAKYRQIKASY